MKIELKEYQKKGLRFINSRKRSYIAFDMGLGKTVVASAAVAQWPGRTLVVCPKIMKLTWIKTLGWFGKKASKDKETEWIVVTNYERVKKLKERYRNIIIDEAHMIKNFKAQRSKNVIKLTQYAERIILLSGTPVKNRIIDLYPQLKILRHEVSINWERFVRRYCGGKKTRFGWWVKGATNLDELKEKVRNAVYRVKKEEVETLPKKQVMVIEIETGAEKQVQKITKEGIGLNELERVKSLSVGSMGKLAEARRLIEEEKASELKELIKEEAESEKIVLATYHQTVSEMFDNPINGSVSEKERETIIEEWRKKENGLLTGTLGVMETGITLTEANIMYITGIPLEPSRIFQVMDRIHRIGQTRDCIIKVIISGELEREILGMVLNKQDLIEQVF